MTTVAVTSTAESRTGRVGRDFAALTGGWAVRAALGLLISVLTARYLAPEVMGRYAFLVWLTGLAAIALSLGLPTTLTRYTAEALGAGRPREAGALLRLVVRWQATLTLAAALAVAAAGLAAPAPWRLPLVLVALSVPLLVLHGSLAAFLSGLQRFRPQAALGVATLILQAALLIGVIALDAGLAGLLAAHATVSALALGVVAWLARAEGQRHRALPAGPPLAPGARLDVLAYARGVSAIVMLDAIVWQRTEVAFLQAMAPVAEVGFYALAFGVAAQVGRIPHQLSAVLFPSFPALVGAGRMAELARLHATAMRYLVLLGAPLAVGLAVTAPAVVRVLYGPAYDGAAPALALLALGGLVNCAAGASPAVLHAVKRQDRLLRQAVLAAVANVVLALALVPALGALGAALASVLAQGLGGGLAIRAAVQVAGAGVPVVALARISLAALVMGMVSSVPVISLDGAAALAAAVLLGGAVYPLALRALRALTAEDLDRARVMAERLPAGARARSLALARYLCRCPVPTRP